MQVRLTAESGRRYHQRRVIRIITALHCREKRIVVESVAERLVRRLQTFGALLPPYDTDKLAPSACRRRPGRIKTGRQAHRACWKPPGSLSCKSAASLIALVSADDPWVTSEQLMPMRDGKSSDFDINSALALALKG